MIAGSAAPIHRHIIMRYLPLKKKSRSSADLKPIRMAFSAWKYGRLTCHGFS